MKPDNNLKNWPFPAGGYDRYSETVGLGVHARRAAHPRRLSSQLPEEEEDDHGWWEQRGGWHQRRQCGCAFLSKN